MSQFKIGIISKTFVLIYVFNNSSVDNGDSLPAFIKNHDIKKGAFGRGLIDKQNLVSSYKFTLNKGDIDRLDYFFTRY